MSDFINFPYSINLFMLLPAWKELLTPFGKVARSREPTWYSPTLVMGDIRAIEAGYRDYREIVFLFFFPEDCIMAF
jgi:hypothetical protein